PLGQTYPTPWRPGGRLEAPLRPAAGLEVQRRLRAGRVGQRQAVPRPSRADEAGRWRAERGVVTVAGPLRREIVMPSQIDWKGGRRLKVADEHAGKRVRCPGCKTPLAVPEEEEPIECDVLEEQEEAIQEEPRRPPAKAKRREEEEPEGPRKGK